MSTSAAANPLAASIRRLALGQELPGDELTAAFDLVMSGEATPAQLAALLMGLRVKGETAVEVAAVVRAMRRAMVALPAERSDELVDTCGTGGGSVQTFNISTAAALVAAGAGVRVAKHGNRSFTTQCGSADVLEALGISIDAPVEVMARSLAEAGIVFMFAPLMHPAMRHVGPVRGQLGIPTVMNIVGPLSNPAFAGRQVVGVGDAGRVPLIAGALRELGTIHALVVHGEPGLDELSPLGPTRVIEIRDGESREWTLDPERFGLTATREELAPGGPPAANAEIVLRVLEGKGNRGATAAVLLNAGAAIYVAGLAGNFEAGLERARQSLDSGAALGALDRLRAAFARRD